MNQVLGLVYQIFRYIILSIGIFDINKNYGSNKILFK